MDDFKDGSSLDGQQRSAGSLFANIFWVIFVVAILSKNTRARGFKKCKKIVFEKSQMCKCAIATTIRTWMFCVLNTANGVYLELLCLKQTTPRSAFHCTCTPRIARFVCLFIYDFCLCMQKAHCLPCFRLG